MLIQVNTDSETRGTEALTLTVQALIEDKFARFADRITRVEVHLNDENSAAKGGGIDKRCMIEVRLAGRDPMSATDRGASHDQALRGAITKMQSKLDAVIGKLGRA
ncbi:MAG TPA: HPF/RaiA family ribosome-associated protein [Phycisphaerales bacterium]|nr:HPF/RaiA family ribosome-associated protein [Phycisphaerales bacterium]